MAHASFVGAVLGGGSPRCPPGTASEGVSMPFTRITAASEMRPYQPAPENAFVGKRFGRGGSPSRPLRTGLPARTDQLDALTLLAAGLQLVPILLYFGFVLLFALIIGVSRDFMVLILLL